jgi:hypothetical protein
VVTYEYSCARCGAHFGILGTGDGSEGDLDAELYFDQEIEYHLAGGCSVPLLHAWKHRNGLVVDGDCAGLRCPRNGETAEGATSAASVDLAPAWAASKGVHDQRN